MGTFKPTVKDVANEAGVTAQTVSRVFRDSGYIAPKTREKVYAAARKLNYIPNRGASLLRSGERKSIAVVFDSLTNIYFAVMIEYLQQEIASRGYTMLTVFSAGNYITEDVYRSAISMGAGAVISFLEPEPALDDATRVCGVPLMLLGRRTDLENVDYVMTDDERGGRLAAERLADDGCRSFLYIAIAMDMTCGDDRRKGFEDALAERGYTTGIIRGVDGLDGKLAAYEAQYGRPDGIFCFCDMIAFGVLDLLKRQGNDSTEVIGYDDLKADVVLPVRLTSVGTDKRAYVRFALDKLFERMRGGQAVRAKADVYIDG